MNKILAVYRKELLDVIRDRRTIISMVVLPVLIFPVITIGFSNLVGARIEKTRTEAQPISIEGSGNFPELARYISSQKDLSVVEVDDVKKAMAEEILKAAVIIPDSARALVEGGDSTVVYVLYDGAEIVSEFARNKIVRAIDEYADSVVTGRLTRLGGRLAMLKPIVVDSENIASQEKMSGFVLSMFLPYIIVILTMIGAMYPAIDLTAGEKERGTMETILASPASRFDIAAGKFLTVFTTSMVTALLSVSSLTLSAGLGLRGMGDIGGDMTFKMQPEVFIIIIILLIPVAVLFSSILMTVALFAKSYKEAQSYITPLMFIVIIPAMMTFVPGIELDYKLALVPVVNVTFVVREALLGNYNWGHLGLVFLSTSILSALAVFIAKRQFDREEVLFRI
jgi:sodium transport system permease protein